MTGGNLLENLLDYFLAQMASPKYRKLSENLLRNTDFGTLGMIDSPYVSTGFGWVVQKHMDCQCFI